MTTIKVSIVDDHKIVINGLVNMLESFENITVTSIYQTGEELLSGLKNQVPDILLLDIQLPDITGDQLAKTISLTYPAIRIIALTGLNTTYYVKEMLENGADGYLLKNIDGRILAQAIETVHKGGQFIDPALRQQLLTSLVKDKRGEHTSLVLTRREKEVLKLLADGNTSKEIAAKLFISPRTVENHKVSLLHRLDVKNTIALVRKAIQMGLLEEMQ